MKKILIITILSLILLIGIAQAELVKGNAKMFKNIAKTVKQPIVTKPQPTEPTAPTVSAQTRPSSAITCTPQGEWPQNNNNLPCCGRLNTGNYLGQCHPGCTQEGQQMRYGYPCCEGLEGDIARDWLCVPAGSIIAANAECRGAHINRLERKLDQILEILRAR